MNTLILIALVLGASAWREIEVELSALDTLEALLAKPEVKLSALDTLEALLAEIALTTNCVRILTGNRANNDGPLKVSYVKSDSTVVDLVDLHWYNKGATVYEGCLGSAFDRLQVTSSKSHNAWGGTFEHRAVNTGTYRKMSCSDCTTGFGAAENIGVDGNGDGVSLGAKVCLSGTCNIVRYTAPTTSPTTTLSPTNLPTPSPTTTSPSPNNASCDIKRGALVYVGCGYTYQSSSNCNVQCAQFGGHCSTKQFIPAEHDFLSAWPGSCGIKRLELVYLGCGYIYQKIGNCKNQCSNSGCSTTSKFIPTEAVTWQISAKSNHNGGLDFEKTWTGPSTATFKFEYIQPSDEAMKNDPNCGEGLQTCIRRFGLGTWAVKANTGECIIDTNCHNGGFHSLNAEIQAVTWQISAKSNHEGGLDFEKTWTGPSTATFKFEYIQPSDEAMKNDPNCGEGLQSCIRRFGLGSWAVKANTGECILDTNCHNAGFHSLNAEIQGKESALTDLLNELLDGLNA